MAHRTGPIGGVPIGGSKVGSLVGVLVAGALLVGCSSVPDAANPVVWYKDTVDFFAGEESAPANGTQPPADERGFPSLATVPERPATMARERRDVAEGLVADRDQARYSSEVIARQGEAVNALADNDEMDRPGTPTASAMSPPMDPAPALPASQAAAVPVPAGAPSLPPTPSPQPTSVEGTYRAMLAERYVAPADGGAGRAPVDGGVGQPSADRAGPRFRLKAPAAAASPAPVAPAYGRRAPSPYGYETVVISSSGIESAGEGAYGYQSSSAGPAGDFGDQEGFGALGGRSTSRAGFGRSPGLSPNAVRVATIRFEDGSSVLDPRDRQILGQVLQLLKQRGGTLRVVGHASSRTATMDPVRHKMVNYEMSVKRADSVARELVHLGAAEDSVLVDARSDAEPLYYEVMPTGEAGNRRTEIYLDV